MTDKVYLVTPPDILHNNYRSILFVYPRQALKEQLQEWLSHSSEGVNVYLHESDNNFDWLLTVAKMSDEVIIDLDNCGPYTRDLAAFIIGDPKTRWITDNENQAFDYLAGGRVYDLSWLYES